MKIETNTNGQEFYYHADFSLDSWYHIVLSRDNNTIKYYRNGVYLGEKTIYGSDNLTISQIGFSGRSFNGLLDELGIWNKALTADEVALLYNSGKGLSYPFYETKSAEINDNISQNTDEDFSNSNETESFVFPNPAYDRLFISHEITNQAHIFIYDMHGRLIFDKQVEDGNLIDISGLAKGLYLIKLNDGSYIGVNRFIKE